MKTLISTFILLTLSLVLYSQNPGDVMSTKKIANNTIGMGNSISNNDNFGSDVASIGDINGDGINDLAVGVPHYGASGGVFILFMDTNGTVLNKTIIAQNTNGVSGLTINSLFGYGICSMGDINNDGVPDIGVSEMGCSDGGANTGAIHIITLSSTGTALSQTKISKTTGYGLSGLPLTVGNNLGISIDTIGDLNNDGYNDLIVGSHKDSQTGTNKGAAYVLLLNSNHKVSSFYKIYDGAPNFNAPIDDYDYFGASCCAAGDYDNDGVLDIIVGAHEDDDVISSSGAFYIIHLNVTGSVKSYTKISNSSFISSNPFSFNSAKSLTTICDLDGNGTREIVSGVYRHDSDNGGIVIIFLDSNENILNYNLIDDNDVSSINIYSRFGTSVCFYENYNNDAYPEIVVGAYHDNTGGTKRGATYILSLNQNFTASVTASAPSCYGEVGHATVSGAGTNPPYTYLWNDGSTNNYLNAIAGSYTVTITNSAGSNINRSVIIPSTPPLGITILSDTNLCLGSNLNLSVQATGGTGVKNILWNNGAASGSTFNVSPTTNTIYSVMVSDQEACISDFLIAVNVHQLPTTSFSGLNTAYCSNNDSQTLVGNPAGGTFSGSGISGYTFNPANANIGNNDIIYSYTDSNGCIGKDTNSTNIIGAPSIQLSAIKSSYCENDNSFVLDTVVSPSGGNFWINDVISTGFYPAILGSGTFSIKYEVTNTAGCSSIDSVVTFINLAPNASFSGLETSYCDMDTTINLIGLPSGGIFSGNGISINNFNPSIAGSGYKSVTYAYTNYFGCTDTVIHATTVNALTSINASTQDSIFCNNDDTVNIILSPSGGVLSGSGVNNISKSFDPTLAGTGISNIIYSFTNPHGCISIDTHKVVVNSPVNLSINNLANNYCLNNSPILLSANYSGGFFYGSGVVNNYLYPDSAGFGTHIISYKYDNGCEDTIHQNVTINSIPVVSINGLNVNHCVNNDSIILSASPSGGNFYGNGVIGNILKPSNAGVGISEIQYISAADANGCFDTTQQSINIHAIPNISFSSLTTDQCINTPTVSLIANPIGGSFTGNYISSDNFMPDNAGIGNHKIFYNIIDTNNCSNTDSFTFIVHNLPLINFNVNTSCSNISSMNLTASPSGGNFSGNNVNGSTFSPISAGQGLHTVNYTFTDGYLCTNIDTQTIIVYNIPIITFNISNPNLCSDGTTINLSASPNGGVFTGTGIAANSFSPQVSGVGSFDIIYTASDANACSNSDTNTIIVHALPNISINNYTANNCINNIADTLSATPIGGSFYGAGITDSIFNPYTAGVGIHNISYSFIDNNGCYNSDSVNIQVFDNPILNIISGLNSQNCNNDSPYFINITPSTGIYNSSFIINDSLYPALTPIGKFGFTYSYTDANNCTSSITDSAYNFAAPIANAGNDTLVPCNSAGVIIGEGSYTNTTFMWSPLLGINNPFISNPIANPSQSTVFTVIKTDITTNCSSKDSISIIIPNNANIEIIGDTVVCPGDSIHISAIGADTFYWDNGIIGSNYDNILPITQYVSVYGVDSNNCLDNDSVVILLLPKPQPYLGNDTAIYGNQILNLNAGIYQSYQWNTGHTSQSIDVDANMLSNGNYSYSVLVENSDGCFGSDTISISITTGISDVNSIIKLKYYPNPVSGILNIEWSANDNISIISIYDSYGRNIKNLDIANSQTYIQIYMSTLAKGVYYIRIDNKQGFKVIVE